MAVDLRPGGLLAALLALLAPGCLAPDPAPEPRYFHPPLAPVEAIAVEQAPRLRVRSLDAAARLTERVAWSSGVEWGYREGLRWTDRPERYLEQALDQALFLSGRFQRSDERGTPGLDATLLAFEERDGQAAVELHALLLGGDGRALLERRFVATQAPAAPGGPEELAAALGQALSAAAAELAAALRESLPR